jgi:tetratricopeptide (TPR) repeat protein
MKKYFSGKSLVLLSALLLLSAQLGFAQGQWTEVRSANFYLVGNAHEREIRRVGTTLEQFRETFARLFPSLRYNSPVPTTVIVFRNDRAFRPYKPLNAEGKPSDWVAGYFHAREDANYIMLSTERERHITYQTIYHEYVHFLVDNSFGRSNIPAWFNEGLAEYYDQFQIEGDIRVRLGMVNQNHLATLSRTRLIPLDQFFQIDNYSLRQQGNHSVNIFYAQAWAMMHFLIHGKQGNRSEDIDKYLQAIRKGATQEEAFKQAFQTDYATMERELRRYVSQRSFQYYTLVLNEKLVFDDQMKSAPLPEPEAKAILGDLLLGSGRLGEAEEHLREALAASPDSLLANSSMGMLKVRQRKFDEARGYLEKARKSDNADHLVHYRYAYLLSREAMDENNWVTNYSNEIAARMRESLKRSIELDPGFPESHRLLAFISIVRGDEVDESLGHIRRAIALAPGNEHYQLDLANLYIRKGEFAAARRLANRIFSGTAEHSVREHAQGILRNADNFEQNAAAIKATREAMSRTDEPPVVIDYGQPPLTEEQLRVLEARAEQISLNRMLRSPNAGERRVLGHLSKIECGKDNSIVYIVKTDDGTLRLTSKDFQGLHLVAFVAIEGLNIGCNSIDNDIFAVLTYEERVDAKTKTVGRLVSIEIVPATFRFIDEEPSN